MSFVRKHWAAILAILGYVGNFEYPAFHSYVASNPHTAAGVILGVILGAFYDGRGKVKVSQ